MQRLDGPRTIVVALGGNALQPPGTRATIADQFRHTRESLHAVVDLARADWHVAIVHGNGPQVGDALERNERAREHVEPLPLGVLVAATGGWIGYMVQQSLQNALRVRGVDREVLTVITQTVVERDDPGLHEATKPIGNVLSDAAADALRARSVAVGRDARGRWRRLAPSPTPRDVVEWDAVVRLVREGKIVIAAAGGGPPVYREAEGRYEGVDAVVDKDRVAAIIGARLEADVLLILTDVDGVYRDWATDRRAPIRHMDLGAAEALLAGAELGTGSMRPKVEAAVAFLAAGGARAIIARLSDGIAALRGTTGTTITRDGRGEHR